MIVIDKCLNSLYRCLQQKTSGKSKKASRDRKKATFPVPLTKLPPLSIIILKSKREEDHYKKARQKTRQKPKQNQTWIYISGAYCRTDDSCDSCCSSDPGPDRVYPKSKRKSYYNGSHRCVEGFAGSAVGMLCPVSGELYRSGSKTTLPLHHCH